MSDPAAAATLRHWNRLIQLAAASGAYSHCLRHYASLLAEGVRGNAGTFPSLAKSCTALRLPGLGAAVHARAFLTGVASDLFVRTSLIDMYAKCGRLPDARRLFDGMPMPHRTVVSWNCIIDACSKSSLLDEAVAMRSAGVEPSEATLASVLSGCMDSASMRKIGLSSR